MMGKKVFLTGGGGYVGSRLAQHLEEHGYEVAVADVKFADSVSGAEGGPKRLRVQVAVNCPAASRTCSLSDLCMHCVCGPGHAMSVALPVRN